MRYSIICILLIFYSCSQPTSFDLLVKSDNTFDLLITGGRIVDGISDKAYTADLLIRDDKIIFIGEVEVSKINVDKTINAIGKTLTPGFIDVHSHADPLFDESMESNIAMGVTTVVIGHDGGHPGYNPSTQEMMSLKTWMDSLEERGSTLNVAVLTGHSFLRYYSEVDFTKGPDSAQLNKMGEFLQEAFDVGVYGMSTGLEYPGGSSADDEELIFLSKIVGENDGIIISHIRSEDDDKIESSIDELIRQGEYARVQVTHLKVVYGKGVDRGKQILAKLEQAVASGVKISADSYPYLASFTTIGIVFPDWASTSDTFEEAKKTREAELRKYLFDRVNLRNGPEATLFTSGEFIGKTLLEVASEQNKSFVDVLMEMGPNGASGAFFVMDKALHDVFTLSRNVMVSSDGASTLRHPRSYGTFARIIEEFVVQDQKITIEDAVYKMTHLPAKTIGLKGRGSLIVGNQADILIFDPKDIHETGTFENPFQLATGFNTVIINGKLVRENSKMDTTYAGKLMRSNSFTPN